MIWQFIYIFNSLYSYDYVFNLLLLNMKDLHMKWCPNSVSVWVMYLVSQREGRSPGSAEGVRWPLWLVLCYIAVSCWDTRSERTRFRSWNCAYFNTFVYSRSLPQRRATLDVRWNTNNSMRRSTKLTLGHNSYFILSVFCMFGGSNSSSDVVFWSLFGIVCFYPAKYKSYF